MNKPDDARWWRAFSPFGIDRELRLYFDNISLIAVHETPHGLCLRLKNARHATAIAGETR